MYSLSIMHSIVVEKSRLPNQGWLKQYIINDSNLQLALKLLKYSIENSTEINFESLNFMIVDTVYNFIFD